MKLIRWLILLFKRDSPTREIETAYFISVKPEKYVVEMWRGDGNERNIP